MFGAKRLWVYPAKVEGFFQKLHRVSGTILVLILVSIPWVRIGGHPLLMLDLPARRFFLAGMVFTPSDSLLLFLFLLTAAFTLFFFTALYGRLWCGFACPQTVFLEEFVRRIEHWLEGNRGARKKLDEAPWTAKKLRIKLTKWSLFMLIAVVVGFSAAGYFDSSYEIWTGRAGVVTYLVGGAFALILYLDFVWFREQFCIYLCPYARFQGVMVDEHSVVIGYEKLRGEPRMSKAALKAGTPKSDFGDCVGCDRCVTVCPTGIDIRDGFQLECISCARCIDACTEVLGRQNKPSLVRFASEAEFEGRKQKTLRARPFVYGTINTVAALAALFIVLNRPAFDLTVAPIRNTQAVETVTGEVQNRYTVRAFNNSMDERTIEFQVEGIEGARLAMQGDSLALEPAGRNGVELFVIAPKSSLTPGATPFHIVATSGDEVVRREVKFNYFPRSPHASMASPRLHLARTGDHREPADAIIGREAP